MTETRSRFLLLLWGGAVFVALSALRWGVVCANPWTSMFATSPIYSHYAEYFSEGVWGTFAALSGLCQLWQLHGYASLHRVRLAASCLPICALHVFCAVCTFEKTFISDAGYGFATCALWEASLFAALMLPQRNKRKERA